MIKKIGFIINPIAGMGGKVGLKGTDGVLKKAIELGAKKIAAIKADETIKEFIDKYSKKDIINWYTCSDEMGYNVLYKNKIKNIEVIYKYDKKTSSDDTKKACKIFLEEKIDLIFFCGGDGTARDIYSVVKDKIPILGIPSGVKMHSAVFAINTKSAAKILNEFIEERLTIGEAEIMDLDEERYRKGEWNIKLYGIAKGIIEPTYVQVGKTVFESISEDEIRDELYEHILDEIEENPEYLYFFGSGGTVDYIAGKLNIKNTLLGIDAVYQKKTIGLDLNEEKILKLLKKYPKSKVILSPIGSQGFILGRGNLQLSEKVVKKIGIDNIIIVSTPSKLKATPVLRVDTGDKNLDKSFLEKEFMMVVIGYRISRVVRLQIN